MLAPSEGSASFCKKKQKLSLRWRAARQVFLLPLDTGCVLCSCSVRVSPVPRTRPKPLAAPDAGGASPARGYRRPRRPRPHGSGRGVAGVALPEPPCCPLRGPDAAGAGRPRGGGIHIHDDQAPRCSRGTAPAAPWPAARLRLAGPPRSQHPAPAWAGVPPAGGPGACGLAGGHPAGGAHPAPAVPHAGHRGRAGFPTGTVRPTGPDAARSITRAIAQSITRPAATAIAHFGDACSAGARGSAAGTIGFLATTAQASRPILRARLRHGSDVSRPTHAYKVTLSKHTLRLRTCAPNQSEFFWFFFAKKNCLPGLLGGPRRGSLVLVNGAPCGRRNGHRGRLCVRLPGLLRAAWRGLLRRRLRLGGRLLRRRVRPARRRQ